MNPQINRIVTSTIKITGKMLAIYWQAEKKTPDSFSLLINYRYFIYYPEASLNYISVYKSYII